jgi:hypothetical protein
LSDEGQQQMAGALSELEAAQQDSPEELEDGATQQEALKGRTVRMRLMTSHRSPTG